MFQVIYKSFKCRLKFVKSAFIHKNVACKRIKSKSSSVVVLPSRPKRMSGINWKSSTIKTFLFQTHFKHDPKGLSVFTLAHKVKNCVFFCRTKIAYIILDHSHILQNWVCHKNSIANLCFKPSQFNFSNFFNPCKNFCPFNVLSLHFFPLFACVWTFFFCGEGHFYLLMLMSQVWFQYCRHAQLDINGQK